MRLGLYGGTFDPIHFGHLILAEAAREVCQLDQVWWIPAAQPPHKRDRTLTADEHRLAMVELATAGHPNFVVSDREIRRGGVSFTADTLAEIAAEDPQRELYFLMGGDSLADLPTWHDPAAICRLAVVVVARRPGSPEPDFGPLAAFADDERIALFRRNVVEMPQIDLSSSDLRRRQAAGESLRYRTPRAVEKYIETAGLYREG